VLESLKAQHERAAEVAGAAGWHGVDDIESLAGLEGQFLWSEDPFNFRVMTFTFDTDKVGSQGKYKLTTGVFTIEEGVFLSIPNNPAIGFAVIVLSPQGGAPQRVFMVAGMFTDDNLKIILLLLNTLGAAGPNQPPFSAVRMI
jgi:hypothetical protein